MTHRIIMHCLTSKPKSMYVCMHRERDKHIGNIDNTDIMKVNGIPK